jgi:hypothetical protein
MRFLNPGMFGLMLLCFLLPFTNIKCNKDKLASFKGYNLIRNAKFEDVAEMEGMMSGMMNRMKSQMPTRQSSNQDRVMEYPLLATASLLALMCLVTLVLAIRKVRERVINIIGISTNTLILLLLAAEIVIMQYVMTRANEEIASRSSSSMFKIDIKLDWGLEIGFYLLAGITLFMLIFNIIRLRRKDPIVQEPHYTPPPQSGITG